MGTSVRDTKLASRSESDGARAYMFEQLEGIARAIVQTLSGSFCEVVVHDFARPEASIVCIAGTVTGREPGGSMSQVGLAMLKEGDGAEDKVNYLVRTRDGKILKSSTVPLRDPDGHVFGAFCVNVDVTGLMELERVLKDVLVGDEMKVLTNVHFANDTAEVAQVLLDEVTQQLGLLGPPRDLSDGVPFVRALDKRGFFGIRYSVPLLATYLGVSRATIYNYLEKSREDAE